MPDTNARIPIEWHELLRVKTDSITDEIRQDLEQVWRLVSFPFPQPEALACAATLLANAMGGMQEFNPVSLPFGYENAHMEVQHTGWVLQKDLERVAIQILGFALPDQCVEIIAVQIRSSYKDAVSSGLLESQRYDAWRPGMTSGSGWTKVYRVTPYGVARARRTPVRSGQLHPALFTRSQRSSDRKGEPRHEGSAVSEAVKQPMAADAPGAGDRNVAPNTSAQMNASDGAIIVNNTIQIDHRAVIERVLAELSTSSGVEPATTERTGSADGPAGADASRPQPGKGMPIAEVIGLAEQHVRAHDGVFPGRNKLAKIVGCSASSVSKAIKQSAYLKARQAEHEAAKSSGREVQIEGSLDQFAADPESEEEDRDEELERLIAEQQAGERREERQSIAARRQRKAD